MKNFHPTPKINGPNKQRRRGMKAMSLLAKQLQGKTLTQWEQRFYLAVKTKPFKHQPTAHNFGYVERG